MLGLHMYHLWRVFGSGTVNVTFVCDNLCHLYSI